MLKLILNGFILMLLGGCTTYAVLDNEPKKSDDTGVSYSLQSWDRKSNTISDETAILLAFSGGGTRAAVLAYGVLAELNSTYADVDGKSIRLLDAIDRISSVSGGSFTAAYYGLYGDKIFTDFEEAFLRRDIQGELYKGLLNPQFWFSSKDRTEMAINYYQKHVFHGAVFADLIQPGRPQILINASDIGLGVRFSFVQEYFDLLCSDLSSFSVARAVTASSAVPVLFNPVVVKNHSGCETAKPDWLNASGKDLNSYPQLAMTAAGLESYLDKERRKYIHFVDGGITDNLGLRALYEFVGVAGGARSFFKLIDRPAPHRLVIITVDASASDSHPEMDSNNKPPSVNELMSAVSRVQLSRYNKATLELVQQHQQLWAKDLSTPGRTVIPYFIQLSFNDIKQSDRRLYFNSIPTSFSLSDEQVDRLIEAGHELLRNNPEYQRLIADLNGVTGKD